MTIVGFQPPSTNTHCRRKNTLHSIQLEMLYPTDASLSSLYLMSTQTKVYIVCDGKIELYLTRALLLMVQNSSHCKEVQKTVFCLKWGATDLWFWENVTGQTAPKTELRVDL